MHALFMLLAAASSETVAIDPNHPDYIIIASTETVLQKMYPKESAQLGEQGIVQFRIETDRRGDLGLCQVVGSSGYARLDTATCDLLIGKALFKRVKRDGRTVKGVRYGQVNWLLPELSAKADPTPPKSTQDELALAAQPYACMLTEQIGSLVKKTKHCMRGGDFDDMRRMFQQNIDLIRMGSPQNCDGKPDCGRDGIGGM